MQTLLSMQREVKMKLTLTRIWMILMTIGDRIGIPVVRLGAAATGRPTAGMQMAALAEHGHGMAARAMPTVRMAEMQMEDKLGEVAKIHGVQTVGALEATHGMPTLTRLPRTHSGVQTRVQSQKSRPRKNLLLQPLLLQLPQSLRNHQCPLPNPRCRLCLQLRNTPSPPLVQRHPHLEHDQLLQLQQEERDHPLQQRDQDLLPQREEQDLPHLQEEQDLLHQQRDQDLLPQREERDHPHQQAVQGLPHLLDQALLPQQEGQDHLYPHRQRDQDHLLQQAEPVHLHHSAEEAQHHQPVPDLPLQQAGRDHLPQREERDHPHLQAGQDHQHPEEELQDHQLAVQDLFLGLVPALEHLLAELVLQAVVDHQLQLRVHRQLRQHSRL